MLVRFEPLAQASELYVKIEAANSAPNTEAPARPLGARSSGGGSPVSRCYEAPCHAAGLTNLPFVLLTTCQNLPVAGRVVATLPAFPPRPSAPFVVVNQPLPVAAAPAARGPPLIPGRDSNGGSVAGHGYFTLSCQQCAGGSINVASHEPGAQSEGRVF